MSEADTSRADPRATFRKVNREAPSRDGCPASDFTAILRPRSLNCAMLVAVTFKSDRNARENGIWHGFYKLVCRPPFLERVAHSVEPQRKPPNSAPGSLFPENESNAERFQYPD